MEIKQKSLPWRCSQPEGKQTFTILYENNAIIIIAIMEVLDLERRELMRHRGGHQGMLHKGGYI